MCGIIFSYNPTLDPAAHAQHLKQALARIQHRGPDDEGLWLSNGVGIGHRRLAIIDLAASRQPMHDAGERYVLTYNGEVYNYRELRAALLPAWQFQTEGDTEVVLAGLAVHGPAFLNKMEGMWALALWDRRERTLLLARDLMGKKPLYYLADRECFSCASELSALRSISDTWSEDLDSTADYLRYGYYLPGTTAYRKVYEVLPGHSLSWQPRGELIQRAYWRLPMAPFTGTRAEAKEQLNGKLTQAVRRRLVADVEVGAFLSGGIDSSLIVGLMTEKLHTHAKTFTIGFHDRSYDERTYARIAAERYGTTHYEEVLEHWDETALEKLVLEHVGQPFADSSLLPTALVAEIAAREVKVVLSGDGGDELFSGYQRYQARAILRWYTRLPRMLRTAAEGIIRTLPEPMAHHSRSVLKKAHLFLDVLARRDAETPYVAPVYYNHAAFAALAPDLTERGHRAPNMPEESRLDEIHEMMAADTLVYLPQDILTKVDRATMAHSIEARAPFLDRDVVELAFSLPRAWHRQGLAGKLMLRDTFTDLLPAALWSRRKQGFGVPIHEWFRAQLGDRLQALLRSHSGILNIEAVEAMLAQHRGGRRDHGYRLWSIYIYLLWGRTTWRAS